MPKCSSKVAPTGASGAKASSRKAMIKAHTIWFDQNNDLAEALCQKDKAGQELSPKETDFIRWWVGYFTANPDPKKPPSYSPRVIRRDKDPME